MWLYDCKRSSWTVLAESLLRPTTHRALIVFAAGSDICLAFFSNNIRIRIFEQRVTAAFGWSNFQPSLMKFPLVIFFHLPIVIHVYNKWSIFVPPCWNAAIMKTMSNSCEPHDEAANIISIIHAHQSYRLILIISAPWSRPRDEVKMV